MLNNKSKKEEAHSGGNQKVTVCFALEAAAVLGAREYGMVRQSAAVENVPMFIVDSLCGERVAQVCILKSFDF